LGTKAKDQLGGGDAEPADVENQAVEEGDEKRACKNMFALLYSAEPDAFLYCLAPLSTKVYAVLSDFA